MLKPRLIAISGPPCSGKSTLARELQQRTGIVHLELDDLRSKLLPGAKQDQHERDIAYRAMHLIGEHLVRAGHPVILDATYVRHVQREALRHLADATDVPLRVIQCRISAELAVRRFQERAVGHHAVDLTEDRVRDLADNYVYREEALVVPAGQPIGVSIAQIESYIRGRFAW